MRFEGAAEKQRHKACAEILSVTRTRTETVDIYIQLCIAPKETRFYLLIVAEEIVQIWTDLNQLSMLIHSHWSQQISNVGV